VGQYYSGGDTQSSKKARGRIRGPFWLTTDQSGNSLCLSMINQL
jgi:hypothetical protein